MTTEITSAKNDSTTATEEDGVKEYTITIKKHPDEAKYPGRGGAEVQLVISNLMSSLKSSEIEKLYDGSLLLQEEVTSEFFDSLQMGDWVGALNKTSKRGFYASIFEIKSENDNDVYDVYDVVNKENTELSIEDVSVALAGNMCQILRRGGKPFGIETERKIKVDFGSDDKITAKFSEDDQEKNE